MLRGTQTSLGRGASTLVELLVVIAIIGVLVSFLLPAIQSSREAARKAQCQNHLRQLVLAIQSHVSSCKRYPSGGWGASWTGDPDRGNNSRQPGGWVYNLLPFLEQTSIHDLGAGLPEIEKRNAAALVVQQPIAIFNCPTRRTAIVYPNSWPYLASNLPTPQPPMVARSDYAINAGDRKFNTIVKSNQQAGPSTLEEGDTSYVFPSTSGFTGICFLRSEVRPRQVTDGTSHTYAVGEGYLCTLHYATGLVDSDRGHLYIGFAPDTVRLSATLLGSLAPSMDDTYASSDRFGSAHHDGCNFAFCDGSVRTILYEIDPQIHRNFGNRKDGQLTE